MGDGANNNNHDVELPAPVEALLRLWEAGAERKQAPDGFLRSEDAGYAAHEIRRVYARSRL